MRKRLIKSSTQKDGLLKRTFEILRKSSDNEKRKKEIRKREKKSKPKGYRAKKLGAITFWVLFLFMLLIVLVNVFSSNGQSAANEGEAELTNKATSAEGIEFSKSFLVTYFNWNIDNEKRSDRIGRLNHYLTEQLSEQAITSGEWNSTLTRESIVLKDIDNLGDSKAHITFQVNLLFDSTATTTNKQNEDKSAVVPERVKTEKYISVPVLYDEDERRFIVYDLPSFTHVEKSKIEKTIDSETDGLKSISDGSTQNIKAFLDTFFEAYSTDSKDKLTYIVEDPKHQNGLNQTMNFVRLKNTEIFEGKRANEKVVRTEVVLAEPETGIEFTSTYLLVLVEKEGRYTVLFINNKSYIDELKNKKKEEEILEETESGTIQPEDRLRK